MAFLWLCLIQLYGQARPAQLVYGWLFFVEELAILAEINICVPVTINELTSQYYELYIYQDSSFLLVAFICLE